MDGVNESNILTDPVDSAACPKCGAMLDVKGLAPFTGVQCPTCNFEFQVPARFGSFMLLQLLGAGGMGGVYRARDEALNREVAIKVMLKSLGDDPQFVETFQREAQAAAKLNHRNIAQIYSFGQEKGQPYIAMELVSGGSLDKMMAEQGALDPAVVVHVGAQIAEGLKEAADVGMVHGDVKPENILFDNDKNAKLVDFGLSAMASGPGNDVWGTPYYIAPEKVRRQKCDFRSDIYSLGGTLYHAIAGVPPFEGEDATAVVKARFDGPPKKMGDLRKGVPPEVEALIGRMLEVEPQMRYPTYGSLLGDMKRYLAKAGPVVLDKGSKKIVLKGKHGKMVTGQLSATGAVSAAGEVPSGMTPVSEIEAAEEGKGTAGKPNFKMIGLIAGGAVLLLVLIVGGIVGIRHHMKVTQEKAENAAIVKRQATARATIAKTVANAKTRADNIRAFVPQAMDCAKAAADEVVKALGEEVRASMVPPEPESAAPRQEPPAEVPAAAPAAAATASNAVPVLAGGGKISLDPAMIESLVKQLPPNLAKTAKGLAKLPPEEAFAKLEAFAKELPPDKAAELKRSLEVLKKMASGMGGAMQQMAGGMAAAMSNALSGAGGALAPAAAKAVPEAPAAPAEGGDAHPVIAIVRGMYNDAYAIKGASMQADKMVAEIEAQAKTAEGMTRVDKPVADALVKLNNALVGKINDLSQVIQAADASRTVLKLKKAVESVKGDVASLVEQKRLEALEKEKQLKADAAAEKKRQEAAAYKAKIEDERKKVSDVELANVTSLKQLQFREAIRMLKDLADGLETQEAKDSLATALDRVNRIKDFHEYLVGKVPGYKSARGWAISAADQKNLSVGATKILWTEVYAKRLDIVGELINGLVKDEQATKSMRLREKTRVMTNAALCLNLFYKEIPSAQELAKALATEAARQFDVDADVIKQLLPEFFQ